MSLSSILGALDSQVTPSAEPLLPENNIIHLICGRKGVYICVYSSGRRSLTRVFYRQRKEHTFIKFVKFEKGV